MVLAVGDHVNFYNSLNLKNWKKTGQFKISSKGLGVWECPDLFRLQVSKGQEEKWVLLLSHNTGAINGGSGTRYFVGNFNGKTFITDQRKNKWLDYGTDNYAAVSFNNLPNGKKIIIGWMSNWDYATTTPTNSWRGENTIPRTLNLVKTASGEYLLKTYPVENLFNYTELLHVDTLKSNQELRYHATEIGHSVINFDMKNPENFEVILENDSGENFRMGYDKKSGMFYTDRTNSGLINFNSQFAAKLKQLMPLEIKLSEMKILLVIDSSSVEIFLNDGEKVMTNLVYPSSPWDNLKIVTDSTEKVHDFKIQKVFIKS